MTEKLRDSLNRSDPNVAHDIFRTLKFGNVLTGLRRVVRGQNAVTGDTIVLPNMAKAERVLGAYARAGAGTPGPLVVSATPATPGVGEVGWSATGDILFNAADDWTNVDVEYEPVVNVDELELDGFPVVADTLTLPPTAVQAVMLLLVTGYTALGVATQKTVLAAGSVPGAGECALDAAKATIAFNAADAVVRADVTLLKSGVDIGVPLEALSTFI
jgi:hypothetical protein